MILSQLFSEFSEIEQMEIKAFLQSNICRRLAEIHINQFQMQLGNLDADTPNFVAQYKTLRQQKEVWQQFENMIAVLDEHDRNKLSHQE